MSGNDLYGWFEEPCGLIETPIVGRPSYDPPHDAPCPYCGEKLTTDDVRTHSFAAIEGASRSYFYRTHRSCDAAASERLRLAVFEVVLGRILRDGETVE